MLWLGNQHYLADREGSLDALRLLTQSQNNISSRDIFLFWATFQGSAQAAEYVFIQDMIQAESDVSHGEDVFPVLATALRAFGRGSSGWERFLRLLLRKQSSLHSPVSKTGGIQGNINNLSSKYPCNPFGYDTPLDELFLETDTPSEGEAIANRWLQILSSEGYDVVAYLKEEFALHVQQMQLIIPSRCR